MIKFFCLLFIIWVCEAEVNEKHKNDEEEIFIEHVKVEQVFVPDEFSDIKKVVPQNFNDNNPKTFENSESGIGSKSSPNNEDNFLTSSQKKDEINQKTEFEETSILSEIDSGILYIKPSQDAQGNENGDQILENQNADVENQHAQTELPINENKPDGLFGLNSKIKFKVIAASGDDMTEFVFGDDSVKSLVGSFEDEVGTDNFDEADDDFDIMNSFNNLDVKYLTRNELMRYFLMEDSAAKDLKPVPTEQTLIKSSDAPSNQPHLDDLDMREDDEDFSHIEKLRKDFNEARDLFGKAQTILKKRTIGIGTPEPAYAKAYEYMNQAGKLNFVPALEEMAFAHLFGRHVRQNLTRARLMFQELATRKGSPRAQMGLGFLHATGLTGPNAQSSQARALIYYTFAALGGDPYAQMALGFRYKYGYSVPENCESSLSNYRRVAKRVAREVRDSRTIDNPGVIQRIRLQDLMDPPEAPPSPVRSSSPATTAGAGRENAGTEDGSESTSRSGDSGSSSTSSSSSSNSAVLDRDLIKYYKFLAEKGDTQAQIGLGQLLYQGGRGVAPDPREAYNLFYRAATESNNAFAQAFLGKMYLEGIGDEKFLKPNNKTAFDYYTKSAKQGNPMGQTGLGVMYLYGFTINRTLANSGKGDGTISGMNNRGQTVAQKMYKETSESVEDLVRKSEESAKNENVNAQNDNAQNSANSPNDIDAKSHGRGFSSFKKSLKTPPIISENDTALSALSPKPDIEHVTSDAEKAFNYFKLAADQGYPEAQLYLANMFFTGLSVHPNYKVALKYYNAASHSGNLLAFYNLAQMHAIGLGALRSCFTAMELFKNVAERGHWGRMLMEAYHAYQAGRVESALVLYLFLAELGYEAGQSNAAYILENENIRLFAKNESMARAFVLWKRSALQGYNGARLKLGDFYYYGYGTPDGVADYESAAHNYRTAYETQKSARALFNLAYMHERGYGLKKDLHLAKRYYDMAFYASPDAQIPVYLALTKLSLIMFYEQIKQLDYKTIMNQISTLQRQYIPEDWDLYIIMLAAFLLGTLIYTRRRPQLIA